ncbi:MAG: hydroxymyristoyl-ACP dehydratase [Bacteroidales bacterium]|nr:hydroxymyristoyl-ACP dehydratase [Bacteroidales bacterium]
MKEPVVSGADICKYIPQRQPIVMLDSFYGVEDNASVSALTVLPDNLFVEDGHMVDSGIIEHIAQSGAMRLGYESVSKGEPVKLGLIGSVNKLTIDRLPNVGETMVTTIVFEAQIGDVTLMGATVKVGDEVIAQGKMKVATK